jgi:hypothetical protein
MTKIEKKLQKNQKRLSVLNNRYEKLIELNSIRSYVSMILTESGLVSNPKTTKYLNLLLAIKREKQNLWIENRNLNQNYAESLEFAKQKNARYLASITLTRTDLYNLTAPVL